MFASQRVTLDKGISKMPVMELKSITNEQEFVLSDSSAITVTQAILIPAAVSQDEAICVQGDDAKRAWSEYGKGKVEGEGRKKQEIDRIGSGWHCHDTQIENGSMSRVSVHFFVKKY